MCARTLVDYKVAVTVFEKSRGYGGRCATRRDGELRFDHGAQYFTVRDERLATLMTNWERQQVVAVWPGALATYERGEWQSAKTGVTRWVGTPGMSAIGAHLARDLDVRLETTVSSIQRDGAQWRLRTATDADLGLFDVVLMCVPAPQASNLLAPHAPLLAAQMVTTVMHPCMATMVVLSERPNFPYDGAFLNDDPVLSWICRNASKPGRSVEESWVLHASRPWSVAHLDDTEAHIAQLMWDAFARVLGTTITPVHLVAHRWRYALPDPVIPDDALFDAALGLGAAGDWCGGPRVEGALLSGMALARRVFGRIDTPQP